MDEMVETIHGWLERQDRIIEKFGYELVNRKRKELCQNCKRRRHEPIPSYRDCLLLPITSDGEVCPYFSAKHLAGEAGFEPALPGPEPGVLPLDYSPATLIKAAKFGQKIQSLLPNPHPPKVTPTKIAPVLGLRYQPSQFWPAGILFASPTKARVYNKATDNGNETIPQAAAPTPRGTIPRSADETEATMAPSTLPESVTEVASC